jgi:hypothetical protein
MKITVAQLKARLSTLPQTAGPMLGLLGTLAIGLFNPSAFENDYFILLILLSGIFCALIYGADRLKTDAAITPSPKVAQPKALVLFSRCKAAWKAHRDKD